MTTIRITKYTAEDGSPSRDDLVGKQGTLSKNNYDGTATVMVENEEIVLYHDEYEVI